LSGDVGSVGPVAALAEAAPDVVPAAVGVIGVGVVGVGVSDSVRTAAGFQSGASASAWWQAADAAADAATALDGVRTGVAGVSGGHWPGDVHTPLMLRWSPSQDAACGAGRCSTEHCNPSHSVNRFSLFAFHFLLSYVPTRSLTSVRPTKYVPRSSIS